MDGAGARVHLAVALLAFGAGERKNDNHNPTVSLSLGVVTEVLFEKDLDVYPSLPSCLVNQAGLDAWGCLRQPEFSVSSAQVPSAWRQACPRLMHRWSRAHGLEASMPDSFFGLHRGDRTRETARPTRPVDDLREALIQAVRRCIAGEEHVGLLFSGGLDSGLLAWLFAQEACRCSCYTVGFHMEDKKIKSKQPE